MCYWAVHILSCGNCRIAESRVANHRPAGWVRRMMEAGNNKDLHGRVILAEWRMSAVDASQMAMYPHVPDIELWPGDSEVCNRSTTQKPLAISGLAV